MRAVAAVLASTAVALALLARHVFALAAHPIDTAPSGYIVVGLMYALVAALLLGPAVWALLGGGRRPGRWAALAAPATTLAVLPWTAATDAGLVVNILAGAIAAAAWMLAVRYA